MSHRDFPERSGRYERALKVFKHSARDHREELSAGCWAIALLSEFVENSIDRHVWQGDNSERYIVYSSECINPKVFIGECGIDPLVSATRDVFRNGGFVVDRHKTSLFLTFDD